LFAASRVNTTSKPSWTGSAPCRASARPRISPSSTDREAAFYILDGKGYEIHDGIRYDWEAGDIAIVHNNCVHQHFNASKDKPARALVIKTKPMYLFLNMLFQKTVKERPVDVTPECEGFEPREIEEDLNHPKGGY
jgi:gentisate 1,2-dioxygenase